MLKTAEPLAKRRTAQTLVTRSEGEVRIRSRFRSRRDALERRRHLRYIVETFYGTNPTGGSLLSLQARDERFAGNKVPPDVYPHRKRQLINVQLYTSQVLLRRYGKSI
jgi:hypothetical protein